MRTSRSKLKASAQMSMLFVCEEVLFDCLVNITCMFCSLVFITHKKLSSLQQLWVLKHKGNNYVCFCYVAYDFMILFFKASILICTGL